MVVNRVDDGVVRQYKQHDVWLRQKSRVSNVNG